MRDLPSPSAAQPPIVVIDDDEDHLAFLATLLRRAGYDVVAFSKGSAALRHLAKAPTRLIVTDIVMPEMDGFEILGAVGLRFPGVPVLAMCGYETREGKLYLESIRHLGASAAVSKPVDPAAFLKTVAALLDAAAERRGE